MGNTWKWIRFGIIFLFVASVLPHISGMLRRIAERQVHIKDMLMEPLNYVDAWNYTQFFDMTPGNVASWALLGFIALLGIKDSLSGQVKEKGNYERRAEYGSHGTADWMNEREVKKIYYKSQKGVTLGSTKANEHYQLKDKYARLPINTDLNQNIFVLGTSGSRKTSSFVLPHVYDYVSLGESFVITDPKGEVCNTTYTYLKDNDYNVVILDMFEFSKGQRWNFLSNIHDELDLLKYAHNFITGSNLAARDGEKGSYNSDPIWNTSEEELFAALVGFVKQVYPEEKQTMEYVIKTYQQVCDEYVAENLFKVNNITGLPADLYQSFLASVDKTRASILKGLGSKFRIFSVDKVKKFVSENQVNLEKIGQEKTAVFLIIPPEDKTFAGLVTIFWQQVIQVLYRIARKSPGQKLPVPVRLMFEEMANIGAIKDFVNILTTCRGHEIKPTLVYQDIGQIKLQYGQAWESIIANCHTWVILGTNDNTTQRYISEKLGKTTIRVQQVNASKKGSSLLEKSSVGQSDSYQGRQLMTPDEVGRIPNNQVLVMQTTRDPVILYKVGYYDPSKYINPVITYNELPDISSIKFTNTNADDIDLGTNINNANRKKRFRTRFIVESNNVEESVQEKTDNVENKNHVVTEQGRIIDTSTGEILEDLVIDTETTEKVDSKSIQDIDMKENQEAIIEDSNPSAQQREDTQENPDNPDKKKPITFEDLF